MAKKTNTTIKTINQEEKTMAKEKITVTTNEKTTVKTTTKENAKVDYEKEYAEAVIPKGYKANMYGLAKALEKQYLKGSSSMLTKKAAGASGISMVLLKAWHNDCEGLLKDCEEYIRAKHSNKTVDEVTKLRNALATKILKLFNRHFVKDTEGYYEFNKNDVENVIASAEEWAKAGRKIEGVEMALEQRVSIATLNTFIGNIERLFMFKILGKSVLSNERRDALKGLDEITKRANEPKKIIEANNVKIEIFKNLIPTINDKSTVDNLYNLITNLEKENEKLNETLETIRKEVTEYCKTIPQ